jgi:hypothetical protein
MTVALIRDNVVVVYTCVHDRPRLKLSIERQGKFGCVEYSWRNTSYSHLLSQLALISRSLEPRKASYIVLCP